MAHLWMRRCPKDIVLETDGSFVCVALVGSMVLLELVERKRYATHKS